MNTNIFYWHSNNEEGSLWLDDGTEDNVEVIKKLQSHPWISTSWDDEDDEQENVQDEKTDQDTLGEEKVKAWQRGVRSRLREPLDDS